MNRLLNALAFAAVVIAAFVMDSNLPQRLTSCPTVARMLATVGSHELPAVKPLGDLPVLASLEVAPPQIDQVQMQRAMVRLHTAQERMARINMKRVETQVRMAQRTAALSNCKLVKIEQ